MGDTQALPHPRTRFPTGAAGVGTVRTEAFVVKSGPEDGEQLSQPFFAGMPA